MRVDKAVVILAVLLILGWGLGAKDDDIRIGVVDLDQAITSTDEGKKVRDEFERKKRDAEASLQPLIEQAREAQKELEAKRFVLSEEKIQEKRLDYQEIVNRIESRRREIVAQLEVDRERLVGPMRKKLVEVVEELGRDGDFSLIIVRNAPGVMYTREALDVTDRVIERFNKKG